MNGTCAEQNCDLGETVSEWAMPDPARDARVESWRRNQFGLASDGFLHDMAH